MGYTKAKRKTRYKKEYQQQLERDEHDKRMKRQKNRRALDKKGVNRKGKDIDHKKPLSRGGSNKPSNLRLISSKKNRKFKRRADHKPA
tara:strand:- start:1089 stop:1352 length:264 start_codon:yes stop_codon:yes gene_type:complete